jgi:hypothetical protein
MEWDAIYVAANQFKILNDQRSWFVATERVQVDCDGTLIWSSIGTVSFDSTYTIVTITKSVLTDPCTTARVGGVYSGATGNLPPHTHEDDDTGGSGVVGSPPAHEWRNYNTEIRFKDPYGEWGEWADLQGDSIVNMGSWVTATEYFTLEVTTNDGSSYFCILGHTSDASTEPGIGVDWETCWAILASKGDQGIQGIQGPQGIQGIDGPQGLQGIQGVQGEQGDSGIIGTWLGAWETPYGYIASDAVSNDGSSYICILGNTSDATTEPGTGAYWATYWELVASKGDQGTQGTQGIQGIQGIQGDSGLIGTWLGAWEAPYGYVETDCVENDGSSYVCIDDHTSDASTEPGTGVYWASYWELVAQKGTSGDPGINWIEGGWQTSTTYVALDGVSNDSSSYICILGHTSDATTEPGTGVYWATYWEVLAEAGVGGGGGGVVESTWATRPTAGTEGRLHLPTDSVGFPAYDTGSAWVVHHPLNFACSNPPDYGSFTKVGGGSETTLVAHGDGLLLTQMGTASATRNNVGFLVSVPAAPYTLTVGFQSTRVYMASNVHIGLCITDGVNFASSKCVSLPLVTTSATTIYDLFQTWSTFNTYSGVINNTQHIFFPFMNNTLFMRMVDNNSTRSYEFSLDGVIWVVIYSETRTTFLTATHIGLFIATAVSIPTNKVASQAKIFHWTLA